MCCQEHPPVHGNDPQISSGRDLALYPPSSQAGKINEVMTAWTACAKMNVSCSATSSLSALNMVGLPSTAPRHGTVVQEDEASRVRART